MTQMKAPKLGSFTVFKVQNGWIVQTYNGSIGYKYDDKKDRQTTFVFTRAGDLAKFIYQRSI
jgi:hypothetical protein